MSTATPSSPPPPPTAPAPPPPAAAAPSARSAAAPVEGASIEALRRIKQAEAEWELKLRAARGESQAAIEALRQEAENAVKSAQSLADGVRANAVLQAKQEAEREATEILRAGTKAADAAALGAGKSPADKKDEILAAVLAGFL
jgi:vacuolar-type H+-ATPase subunit H